jgi:transposase-like protein
MTGDNQFLEIKPYSITDFSALYGVSARTMLRWIKPFIEEVGPRNGRFYSVTQVKVIIEKLGVPHKLKIDD